jgi:hypothetical protein
MSETKIISIVVGCDCEQEAFSLRSALEYFGFTVVLRHIGRPNDFIKTLHGDSLTNQSDFIVLCFHGQNGRFVMPSLSPEIYEPDEPKDGFDHKLIEKNTQLNQQNIIVTGCTLGREKMVSAFLKTNAKSFIGTKEYPEGNAVLFLVISLFYEISKGKSLKDSFAIASNIDDETKLFELHY